MKNTMNNRNTTQTDLNRDSTPPSLYARPCAVTNTKVKGGTSSDAENKPI